jgi:adenine-specific DNA methylase
VVTVHGYRTEMYCVSCEVGTEFIYVMYKKVYRLRGLVVTAPGYRTEVYCVSRTEFIYVMWKKVDRLRGLVVRVPGYRTEMNWVSCEVRTEFICYVEER